MAEDLKKEIEDLKEIVKGLVELEQARVKQATDNLRKEIKQEPMIDKEELKEELKEVHLGELVIYALKNNLIKRKEI